MSGTRRARVSICPIRSAAALGPHAQQCRVHRSITLGRALQIHRSVDPHAAASTSMHNSWPTNTRGRLHLPAFCLSAKPTHTRHFSLRGSRIFSALSALRSQPTTPTRTKRCERVVSLFALFVSSPVSLAEGKQDFAMWRCAKRLDCFARFGTLC